MSIPPLPYPWTREDKPQQQWNGQFKQVTTFILKHGSDFRATIHHRPDDCWEVYTYSGSPTVTQYAGTFLTLRDAQQRALDLLGVK